MYFIVSSLFPISLHWCPTGNDGLQTVYWNSLHVFPYSVCLLSQMRWSAAQRDTERRVFSFTISLYLTAELCWGAWGFLKTLTVHWGSWSSLFRDPCTSIHNTHKQRLTINMQIMCFGIIICFQRVNSVICITLNFFIWTGLLDCHCSSERRAGWIFWTLW